MFFPVFGVVAFTVECVVTRTAVQLLTCDLLHFLTCHLNWCQANVNV